MSYKVRRWEDLYPPEKMEYYQWIQILIDQGKLNITNELQFELKARAMYEADNDHTRERLNHDFDGLDIDFKDYS